MPEIKLQKRIIYSGEVFASLMSRGWGCTEASNFLRELREADAVEVVHGRWIKVHEWCGVDVYRCSACGREHPRLKTAYCCDCGAKMDSERREGE